MVFKVRNIMLRNCFTLFFLLAPIIYGRNGIVANVTTVSEQEIRYSSGKVVYVEGLIDGQWVGRQWSADGQIKLPYRQASKPAFEIQIKLTPDMVDGIWLEKGWQWVDAKKLPESDGMKYHFVVELSNRQYLVHLKIHTLMDGTTVLMRWLEIINISEKPIALSKISPWAGILWCENTPVKLGYATKSECFWEGWFGWKSLVPGANIIKNDKGLAWNDPYFVLHNMSKGEYFFGQLAWAVNYDMEFNMEDNLSFKIGPTTISNLRVVEPGEAIETPSVHLCHIRGDFDDTVQAMHEHIRRSVVLKRNPEQSYLIQYTLPEDQPLSVYRGDDYNEANLKKCIDVAATIGAEVFCLDGPTWAEGTKQSAFGQGTMGNWTPREKWFPRGFGPLVDYAREKGLIFGLYAQPEGGNGNWSQTKAFQKNPEWFVSRRPVFPGRNFLRISIPEAAAYMESEITQIIENNKLGLYRHEQNGAEGGEGSVSSCHGFMENDYWRHYEALYSIFGQLHKKYPNLILSQCSAGGTRLDLATLSRFHEHFSSDNVCYPHVYRAASGLSVYLPPEVLITPIGMCGPFNNPDFITMLRSIYAIGNSPYIFNAMLPKSVEEFNPDILDGFLRYNKLYKTFIRPMLSTCNVYHHSPVNATGGVESSNWFAMEFTSPDRQKGWATIICLSNDELGTYLFKPKGLDGHKKYYVTFDNTDKKKLFDGKRLMQDGLRIKLTREIHSELLMFEVVY